MGTPGRGQKTAGIRGQFTQLQAKVHALEQLLMKLSANPTSYNLTRQEIVRRGDVLAKVKEDIEELKQTLQQDAPQWKALRADKSGYDPSDPRFLEQLLGRQDAALDDISGSVASLKQMGLAMARRSTSPSSSSVSPTR